ncbi:MAG: amino acid ABC transporter permease [Treponema sp.]|nr:amino acid ABC transporter permease [Treponema sp.]
MNREFSFEIIPKLALTFLPFLKVTLLTLLLALIFGTIIATVLVKLRLSKRKSLNIIAYTYIAAIRCTPAVILIFIVFYGLPFLLQLIGIDIIAFPRIFFITVALSISFSATFSEVMRTSYLAVNKGQTEAAIALGLSGFQAFYRIVLPQAFVYALPNFGNSLIMLFKETSLAYTIGVVDLMGKMNLYISYKHGRNGLEAYITVGLIYWVFVLLFERIFTLLDKKNSRGLR